jgi:hypothetical protein
MNGFQIQEIKMRTNYAIAFALTFTFAPTQTGIASKVKRECKPTHNDSADSANLSLHGFECKSFHGLFPANNEGHRIMGIKRQQPTRGHTQCGVMW